MWTITTAFTALFYSGFASAQCGLPAELSVHSIHYERHTIEANLEIMVVLPDWTTLPCTERPLAFGTAWDFEVPEENAVLIWVRNARGDLVQERTLTGPMWIKQTPTWSDIVLSDLHWDVPLSNYQVLRVHMEKNQDSVLVSDQGRRIRLPARIAY